MLERELSDVVLKRSLTSGLNSEQGKHEWACFQAWELQSCVANHLLRWDGHIINARALLSISIKCWKLENVSQRRWVIHLANLDWVPAEGQDPLQMQNAERRRQDPVLKELAVYWGGGWLEQRRNTLGYTRCVLSETAARATEETTMLRK